MSLASYSLLHRRYFIGTTISPIVKGICRFQPAWSPVVVFATPATNVDIPEEYSRSDHQPVMITEAKHMVTIAATEKAQAFQD